MAGNILKVQDEFADPENKYSFPSTSDYCVLKGANHSVMIILGTGAPSTDHNSATLGSLYIDKTNYVLYIMTAAATWTKVGTQS